MTGKNRALSQEIKTEAREPIDTSFAIAGIPTGKLNALVKNLANLMHVAHPDEVVRIINAGEWDVSDSKLVCKKTNIVLVDRSVPIQYPHFIERCVHRDLENTGPSEFNVEDLALWLHDEQKTKLVNGDTIYMHLRDNYLIKNCLGLHDLMAIQKNGLAFYRKYFGERTKLFGWRSVSITSSGDMATPFLYDDGYVGFCWRTFYERRDYLEPAAMFKTEVSID